MIDFNEIKCYRCGEKGHFSCGVIDSTPREEELSKRITDAELNSSLLVAKNKELEECISELRYELGQERISDLKNSGIEEEFIKIKEERDFYITRTLDLYQEIHKLWDRIDGVSE